MGLRGNATAMPVAKSSFGDAVAAAAMLIQGTWPPSVNSMPEKPASSSRTARSALSCQVIVPTITSMCMV